MESFSGCLPWAKKGDYRRSQPVGSGKNHVDNGQAGNIINIIKEKNIKKSKNILRVHQEITLPPPPTQKRLTLSTQ